MSSVAVHSVFFFFNDTATTEIYTLSLHDALPISEHRSIVQWTALRSHKNRRRLMAQHVATEQLTITDWVKGLAAIPGRSEEHTSELQSRLHLVCRLLLEKKKAKPSLVLRT